MAGRVKLERSDIDRLFASLQERGYETVGPTERDGAVVYDSITKTADLPVGRRDVQAPGRYRLEDRPDDALFGYVVGPHSWKRFLHPPEAVIWQGSRSTSGFETVPSDPAPRYAFIGVRPCELAAILIQDRVFAGVGVPDEIYDGRRSGLFVVAVNCTEPGDTCFCTSMGTGPAAGPGADLVLTEVIGEDSHWFTAESVSDAGTEVLAALDAPATDSGETAVAEELVAVAADRMGRTVDTTDIRDLLFRNLESREYERVAARCLGCANCTMACPTCFCATVEDGLSLDQSVATRTRRWDSCFSLEFSYIHGGPLRVRPEARYRQWLTHKFAGWIDQFGTSGCVGCGRCITWCPVGIDVTEEIAAIRRSEEHTYARH
jgi:ferredoxin